MKKKHAYGIIWLSYFKQGDDLHGCLEHNKKNLGKAFEDHSLQMLSVSEHLGKLTEFFKKNPKAKVEVDAMTHHIGISGDSEVIEKLIKMGLVEKDDMEEEEEE